jgi:hypothetical protein
VDPSDDEAVALLRRYYYGSSSTFPGNAYTGARFDGWAKNEPERFTADDLVAVGMLSVRVSPRAAIALLVTRADEFNGLLADVGEDLDLVDVSEGEINENWPAWVLHDRLRTLRDVDWVIAGKLLARKRPRLLPVYDRIVRQVVGRPAEYWDGLRSALAQDGTHLHARLVALGATAGLPESITALRVFDVIAWMTGKQLGY